MALGLLGGAGRGGGTGAWVKVRESDGPPVSETGPHWQVSPLGLGTQWRSRGGGRLLGAQRRGRRATEICKLQIDGAELGSGRPESGVGGREASIVRDPGVQWEIAGRLAE